VTVSAQSKSNTASSSSNSCGSGSSSEVSLDNTAAAAVTTGSIAGDTLLQLMLMHWQCAQ
jgi:hypothetical protein